MDFSFISAVAELVMGKSAYAFSRVEYVECELHFRDPGFVDLYTVRFNDVTMLLGWN